MSHYVAPSSITIGGDLDEIIRSAPTPDMLLLGLQNLEATRLTTADKIVLGQMLSGRQRADCFTEDGGVITIPDHLPAITEAINHYKNDHRFLMELQQAQYEPLRQILREAFGSLSFKQAQKTSDTPYHIHLQFEDSQEAGELQRLIANIQVTQVNQGDVHLIFQAPLFTPNNFAWADFQRLSSPQQNDLFISGHSPLRHQAARKARLAACLCRQLLVRANTAGGESASYIVQDLKSLRHEKPGLWKRLSAAANGIPVKQLKVDASLSQDSADRGDGAIAGNAKDGKRLAKALRNSRDLRRTHMIEQSVSKGSATETVNILGEIFGELRGCMSSLKLNREHSEAFVLQIGGGEYQIYSAIFESATLMLETQKSNTSGALYQIIHKNTLERLRSRAISQSYAGEDVGAILVNILSKSEDIKNGLVKYWSAIDDAVVVVRKVRTIIQETANQKEISRTVAPSFVSASAQQHQKVIDEERAIIRARLQNIMQSSEELGALSTSLLSTIDIRRAETFFSYDDGLVMLANLIKKLADEIQNVVQGCLNLIDRGDDGSLAVKTTNALSQFCRHYAVERDIAPHDMESAILKATEMTSADWSVGKREEFAPWMYDAEQVFERFGLRTTEFGASISKNKGKIRNGLLKVSVSMDDMAKILNVDPKLLSFHGRVGVSVAARGRPGSIAYYNRANSLMAFKDGPSGDGSFAHEWFHAFDFSGTGQSGLRNVNGTDLDPEISEAIGQLRRAMIVGDKARYVHQINLELDIATDHLTKARDRIEAFKAKELDEFKMAIRDAIASIITIREKATANHLESINGLEKYNLQPRDLEENIYNKITNRSSFMAAGFSGLFSEKIPASRFFVERRLLPYVPSPEERQSVLSALKGYFDAREECLAIVNSICVTVDRFFDQRKSRAGIMTRYKAAIDSAQKLVSAITKAKQTVEICASYMDFERSMNVLSLPRSLTPPSSMREELKAGGWPSKMLMDAQIADQNKNKLYFSTIEEMGARAFEMYSAAKMAAAGLENTFLIDAARANPDGSADIQIYPKAEIAAAIIEAFDNLMTILRRRGSLTIR
jgi:hypothetical protein